MKASEWVVLLVTYKCRADGVGVRDREVITHELSGLGGLCLRAVSSVRMDDDGSEYFALYVQGNSLVVYNIFFLFHFSKFCFKCRKWYAVIFLIYLRNFIFTIIMTFENWRKLFILPNPTHTHSFGMEMALRRIHFHPILNSSSFLLPPQQLFHTSAQILSANFVLITQCDKYPFNEYSDPNELYN